MKKKYLIPYIDYIVIEQEDSCLLTLSNPTGNADPVAPERGGVTSPEIGVGDGSVEDPTEGFGDAKGSSWFDDSKSDW